MAVGGGASVGGPCVGRPSVGPALGVALDPDEGLEPALTEGLVVETVGDGEDGAGPPEQAAATRVAITIARADPPREVIAAHPRRR
jgi:hypothetical protein